MSEYLSKKIKFMSFFSIIAVVFIHAYNFKDSSLEYYTIISEGKNWGAILEYTISAGLARFTVPLFFMISGFLFYRNYELSVRGYFTKVKKRFFSLFIPFVLWAAISIGFVVALKYGLGLTSSEYVNAYNPNTSLVDSLLFPQAFQLWYVKALLFFTIISPIGYLLIKHGGIAIVSFLFVLWVTNVYPELFITLIRDALTLFFSRHCHITI